MSRFKSVGIYGSSSGRNAGDAALISGIMDGLDQELGRRLIYEIPTLGPNYIWNNYPNKTRPISMLPWHAALGMFSLQGQLSFARCGLNLIYDNMLFDKKLWHPVFNYMPAVWWYFTKCRVKGQLLALYNVGCGPVTTERGRKMLREIADCCDILTVRDNDSKQLLQELGVNGDRVLVTADAALTVNPAPETRVSQILKENGIESGQELLAINVNSYLGSWSGSSSGSMDAETFARIYGEALTRLAEELKVPLVFVTTQHSDVVITKQVREQVRSAVPTYLLTNVQYNHAEMKGVLGKMSFLFAMRLHSNILATSMCTPSVALSFQKKVASYYSELGLPDCVMSFDDFSADNLFAHAKRGWEHRAQIKRHLTERIPLLQEKSLVTAKLLGKIDDGWKIEDAIQFGKELLLDLAGTLPLNKTVGL